MPLIVDTYNVLHVVGILPPEMAGIDTRGLIDLLRNSRHGREKTTLVCDGIPHEHAPRGRFGPIIVRYSGSNRLADDLIKNLIDESSTPRRLVVISSDNEILRAARRRRCKTISSQEFLRQLVHDARKGPAAPREARPTSPLSSDEVSDWAREFGVDEDFELLQPPDLPVHLQPPEPPTPFRPTPPDARPSDPGLPPHAGRPNPEHPPAGSDAGESSASPTVPLVDLVPPEILAEAERLLAEEAKRLAEDWPELPP